MKNLREEYFSESHLDNHSLEDIGKPDMTESDPENWVYVRARVSIRSSGLYSESICRVLRRKNAQPLVDDGIERMTVDEVVDEMPRGPREQYALPSIKGGYLSVVEVKPDEQSDGTIIPQTRGRSTTIPVEYVIEPLSYDEVVTELVDETL